MKPFCLTPIAGLFALVISVAAAPPLWAQNAEAEVQENPSTDELRNEALALIYASPTADESTRTGIASLQQIADTGDADAQVALGDLYLYGTLIPRNWDKALGLYESAAEQGNGLGIHNYGMMLMWGQSDPAKAEAMLVRAGDMGVSQAWATLSEGAMYGYLGSGRESRAKFDDYAARGRAEDVDRIAVLESIRYMWGISVTANGPQTLSILEDAADQGNAEAAQHLIRLVRDGNQYNIRSDKPRAEEMLQAYAELLDDDDAAQLALTINAAKSRLVSSFAGLVQILDTRPELIDVDFGRDLFAANPNAAIFVLQAKLRDAGYSTGRPDGLAGPRTVKALTLACQTLLTPDICRKSVIGPDVVSQLISQMWQDQQT